MRYHTLERWPTDRQTAKAMLADAARLVEITGNVVPPQTIAAVHTDYGAEGRLIYACTVVLTFPEMEECERTYAVREVSFPYYPGLLFYREGMVMLESLGQLKTEADLIIVSGHGIDHPAQCGIASHIGLAFDRPTIGVAKRLLSGSHRPLGEAKGSSQPIMEGRRELGIALRSKQSVKPIFISPGHKCDLRFVHQLVLRTMRGFRLPEPLRVAHLLVNRYRQRMEKDQPDQKCQLATGMADQ